MCVDSKLHTPVYMQYTHDMRERKRQGGRERGGEKRGEGKRKTEDSTKMIYE